MHGSTADIPNSFMLAKTHHMYSTQLLKIHTDAYVDVI